MTRLVSVTVLVVVLAASRLASADDTDTGSASLPNGATITFQHLKTYDPEKQEFVESGDTSDTRRHAFNRASCNCARAHTVQDKADVPPAGNPKAVGWFQYLVLESPASGQHYPVEFWTGTDCTQETNRTTLGYCKPLSYVSVSDIDTDLNTHGGTYLSFNLYDLVNGHLHDEATVAADPNNTDANAARCQTLETNVPLWLLYSTTGQTDTFDYTLPQNIGTLSTDSGTQSSGVDTYPPPLPTNIVAKPSDESINLSWTVPTSRNTDIAYYQVLCADDTGSVARSRVSGARYVTTQSLCTDANPADLAEERIQPLMSTATALDPDKPEQAVGAPGGAFGDLSEAFICGEATSGTANSLKITGLHNATPYRLIFLSIDLHGNYSGVYFDHTVTPIPVTDFWEDLHDGNDNPQGGLCLLAETYGDDSSLTGTLRRFRDDTLGRWQAGRWLGRAYYATLGKLGGWVHGSLPLRIVAGIALAPLVAFALAWHWLTLPGALSLIALLWLAWRKRASLRARFHVWFHGGQWAALGGVALVIALVPGQARADEPYWQNDPLDKSTDSNGAPSDPNYDPTFDTSLETQNNNRSTSPFEDEKDRDRDQDVPVGVGPSRFHVGVKIGPYFPDIDKQAGKPDYGPYRQMFGGYNLMPMLDIEWIPWSTDYGQLTLGGTIGYLQKSADGFVDGSTPGDHSRMRVPGAENKFQLLPLAATVGYRLTYLDDNYGIPVVPYVRGGLSYYVWRVTAPNGDVAEICNADDTNCGNKALGASLGVQGAIGLAIRLERIDAGSAQSMRNSGVQHVGIYGELSAAKVDGFGSDKKLSVGDKTWFAGVDFEF